ncbi:MAG TPA: hypothetical protein VFD39_12265 [Trueperaceae bacterium]|nr:hypothetical protein [Trueperaceae bacterium]
MHPAVAAYEAVYETGYPEQVADLVVKAFTADATLVSPWLPAPVVGHEAITAHVLRTRDRLVGTVSKHTSSMDRVGDVLRWTWAFEQNAETVAEGMDVAVLAPDERMSLLAIFDGNTPPRQ